MCRFYQHHSADDIILRLFDIIVKKLIKPLIHMLIDLLEVAVKEIGDLFRMNELIFEVDLVPYFEPICRFFFSFDTFIASS